ncbi:type I pullulanase [Gaetbulibacter aestuarii]|uniref:Type I pullulanase n=1 Tax=Gaetbulibacter aestuarii TaxID=1502358 RepID=A0ABW7N2Q2_9FLAO
MRLILSFLLLTIVATSCKDTKEKQMTKTAYDTNLWLDYTKEATTFKLWSPTAEKVKLNLYNNGTDGSAYQTEFLEEGNDHVWHKTLEGDLAGVYYTYQINVNGQWLDETPGIYAQAVGINGKRAMVLDLNSTNPQGWTDDQGPKLKYPNEAIIYELQVRDMTIQPEAGSSYPGKFLGLVESGRTGPQGVSTGIDHIKELGVTHVHILPAFDNYSIDETKLDQPQYNWGYDPQNYNVPEGSFSTDPYHADVRIKEFKTMVKAFHDHGIGVILDVVYNHTGRTKESNFNLEAPEYYYRMNEDGSYSDASACGNETASEKEMMRKFMIASVSYWAKEYHLDGFRFDLMGIHDIETMNEITASVKVINPNAIIYGEGWTAGNSPLPDEQKALKKNTFKMPQVSAFSDDIRDGLKGSVFEEKDKGFVSGKKGTEESIKSGVVGAIQHPQINYKKVNYSDKPWTENPWQSVSYVSCHDNNTLYDKLKLSTENQTVGSLEAMDKLANAIILTSQGVAFLHAGSEMLRTKQGIENSFNSPDSINEINWHWKVDHADVVAYYENLIKLRKAHPALRMTSAADVQNNLKFKTVKDGLISYEISNNANGDSWKTIFVVYNANKDPYKLTLDGIWQQAVSGDKFTLENGKTIEKSVMVPAQSMFIAYQE